MTVNLMYNSSDGNRLDKNTSSAFTASGTLKEGCSVTDPTILIAVDDIHNVNYMYIPDFNRYYFVTNVSVERRGLWAVTGHVDVLSTYKSAIRSCTGVIARQQYDYNLYLDDDKFMVESKREVVQKNFNSPLSTEGTSIILIMAG